MNFKNKFKIYFQNQSICLKKKKKFQNQTVSQFFFLTSQPISAAIMKIFVERKGERGKEKLILFRPETPASVLILQFTVDCLIKENLNSNNEKKLKFFYRRKIVSPPPPT